MDRRSLTLVLIMAILIGGVLVAVSAITPSTPTDRPNTPIYQMPYEEGSESVPYVSGSSSGQYVPALIKSLGDLASSGNFTINYTLAEIDGTIVSAKDGLLLMRVDDRLLTVVASRDWLVGDETKSFFELFVDDVINKGDRLSIETVKVTVSSPNRPAILVYVATRIHDIDTGKVAEAILPFSVEQS